MRKAYLTEVVDYKLRLEPLMESLVKEGKWIRLERITAPTYAFNYEGLIYVFKVL